MGKNSAAYMREYRARKRAEAIQERPLTTDDRRYEQRIAELEEEIRHLKQVIAANRSDWIRRMTQEERDAILRKVSTARR